MQLEEGTNANEFAERHGFKNLGQVGTLPNYYRFEVKEEHRRGDVDSLVKKLQTAREHKWSEKQVPQVRVKRDRDHHSLKKYEL